MILIPQYAASLRVKLVIEVLCQIQKIIHLQQVMRYDTDPFVWMYCAFSIKEEVDNLNTIVNKVSK